jgi:hypothetical protein
LLLAVVVAVEGLEEVVVALVGLEPELLYQ